MISQLPFGALAFFVAVLANDDLHVVRIPSLVPAFHP